MTLEWERERRGSGREKIWKKKKQQFPANIGSIATWQLSPPECEKLSSGREPRSACLSCGRALGTGEQKRMWWDYGSGSSMGALPPGTVVLSPPPPPPHHSLLFLRWCNSGFHNANRCSRRNDFFSQLPLENVNDVISSQRVTMHGSLLKTLKKSCRKEI